MSNSPESGQSAPEHKKIPFIVLDLDKPGRDESIAKLKELGWTIGQGSASGELPFIWEGDGEPQLPDDLADKMISSNDGAVRYNR